MKLVLLLLTFFTLHAEAKQQPQKGLLPEVLLDSSDEKQNQKKATQSEVLISRTEARAIKALEGIIKKRKGSPEEASLLDRLAELYMRRAKSGRFFDLFRNQEGPVKFAPPEVTSQTALESLKKAISIYSQIEKSFPQYNELDSVLFNYAFASQQTKDLKNAERAYTVLIEKFPKSLMAADAFLALGEMAYEQQRFSLAIERFKKIEDYPKSKVFSYGLYKLAWALYNSKENQRAIDHLVRVVKINQPGNPQSNHNLRTESLRDLGLFFGESLPPEKAYEFFSTVATKDEIGESLMGLAKLYESHSRDKELEVFLKDFIQREPWAPQLVKAHTFLIRSYESTKKRPLVLAQLKEANELCQPKSAWRLKNAMLADSECDDGLAAENREITRKWWDLWQKNKGHKEIAELTQVALEMHLSREDPLKPDSKMRFAYAELLFQLEKFDLASREYETVAKTSLDSKTRHDSQYAALFCLEKLGAKASKQEIKRLSSLYLEKFPQGEQSNQAKYKLGFVAYEDGDFVEALKWFKPLAALKGSELALKSQDLILDIYNDQKDFESITASANEFLKINSDQTRGNNLKKIKEEAQFSAFTAQPDKIIAIAKFKSFFEENPKSPLAKESLWQAVSLSSAHQDPVTFADLAVYFAEKHPDDKSEKVFAVLNDAGKAYADAGLIRKAAQTFYNLSQRSEKTKLKYLQASAELFDLDGDKVKSRQIYQEIFPLATPVQQSKILWELRESHKGNSAEIIKIEEQLLAKKLQPYSSRIELERAKTALQNQLWTIAFNKAKPLVDPKSGAEENTRAEARLIQAQVLEREFVQTRTKTSLNKLNLILSIKTEKLDAAQTAFLTASKIATDVGTKMKALEGLQRIYSNYVNTVGQPEIKDTLSDEDRTALNTELQKLIAPIKIKKQDIENQIIAYTKEKNADSSQSVDFESLNPLTPSFPVLNVQMLPQPALASEKVSNLLEQVRTDINSGKPQFFMALDAEKVGNHFKAIYLIDLALKKDPKNISFVYQKGRSLWVTDQKDLAYQQFQLAEEMGLKNPILSLFLARLSYGQKNCTDVLNRLKPLSEEVKKFKLNSIISECQANIGEFDQALKTVQFKPSNEDFLQQARIHEVYRYDTNAALKLYEQALSSANKVELKDWLSRKISSLKDVRLPANGTQEITK